MNQELMGKKIKNEIKQEIKKLRNKEQTRRLQIYQKKLQQKKIYYHYIQNITLINYGDNLQNNQVF